MEIIFCHLKGCPRCAGDLVFDEADWRCWQCGHYYYTNAGKPLERCLAEHDRANGDIPHLPPPERATQEGQDTRRKSYGARSARNINSVIRAKLLSDERWARRNRQVIEYLDKGLSIREIAKLVGKGERQIRVVRERLADLRAAEGQA